MIRRYRAPSAQVRVKFSKERLSVADAAAPAPDRRRAQKAAMGLFYPWKPDPAHYVADTPGPRS